jgi:hypothetical protein
MATGPSRVLNGDGKLDIVWGDTAYVNKGDGTFSPLNLAVTGTALAVGDVNGDGVSDVVIDNTIHAGNGDGTFQTAALYTVGTSAGSTFISAAIGDVNGDGNADVVVQHNFYRFRTTLMHDVRPHFKRLSPDSTLQRK